MRKILNLIVVLFMAIVLVACNKPSDDPFKLDEKKAVELSSAEIIDLISNLDQEQIFNNNFKMTFEGSVKEEKLRVFNSVAETSVMSGEGKGEIAVSLTEQVEDAVVLIKAEIEYEQKQEFGGVKNAQGVYEYEQSSSSKVEGAFEAFLVETFAYYNVQAEYKEYTNGTLEKTEKENIKETMKQGFNQEMYEVIKNPLSFIFGVIGGEPEIPEIDLNDFDELLDKLPKIKAYKDGNKYSLLIDINKQIILDKFEAVVYEFADSMELDRPTKAEVDEVIETIEESIKELTFKYLIVIENNKVLNVALDIHLVIYEEVERYTLGDREFISEATRTINLKLIVDKQSSAPVLPTDLDQYKQVDSPSIFDWQTKY